MKMWAQQNTYFWFCLLEAHFSVSTFNGFFKKTKPTPFQKDTWLSRTFWQHSERSDLKINFQCITRRGFNCPFVLAGPETTARGADGGRALRREDTIRESGRAQAAAHSLQQLKACRWKWSCFLSWRESTQFQWLPDWAWFTGRGGEASGACSSERSRCFKGRRIPPHCKVSFPRKEPQCCIKRSTQLFVKDFFVIIGALCQQINCSELGSSNKTHTSGP